MAAADEAIRQVRHAGFLDEATCDTPYMLGIWKPQKCAAWAVVAIRNKAMHTAVSEAARRACLAWRSTNLFDAAVPLHSGSKP